MKNPPRFLRLILAVILSAGMLAGVQATSVTSASATTTPTLDLKVLLIGDGSADVTTAAWASALTNEGVPYTEVDATGTLGAWTVTLPALSSGTTGYFNGVVIADSPADFAVGQLTALDTYEATFGVRQIDGYTAPYLGETLVSGGALDGTTGTLTTAGLAALPELAGPIPFATGTYGYQATVTAGAPFTPWLDNAAGQVLAGVYQHPSSDPQANVAELELGFDYNATMLQWELLATGLINWVTEDTHLGLNRNYVAVDIDDTFTPDNAWSTTLHDNDYSDADSQRMDAADVIGSADWSNPTQENAPAARPAGEPATAFRLDQLFNYGGTVEYQNGELDLPGEPAACTAAGDAAGTCGADPLLAQFQATDPATGKPYSNDFGWISHTYDTPYLDVGCATQDYIEAELNENTSDLTAAPGATPGTGGLGIPEQTIASGAGDVANPYGTYNPQVFVPGNHSGFADLAPGTPATVDPPDLDQAGAGAAGSGTLAAGTYEYAVTDQFNGADSTATDQSQAYVTSPITVPAGGSVSLVWQAICHAANYLIYRASGPSYTNWSLVGSDATPASATPPDNSSGDTSPAQSATVCSGPTYDPTSCAGEKELTYTDTGATGTPEASGWTPPVVENANELPWEQNPYFIPALQAVGITTVGADASKAYPNPANDAFGIGTTYSGATYAAGQPFVDGTAQVAPRHPINIFYNAATNAQELDEYNTLYDADAPGSQCHNTAATTCSTTPFTFAQVINSVVSGMLTNMLTNNPEVSYVHQTNIMGTPPYSTILPPAGYVPAAAAQPGTDGDGTLYEVLNPLISEYDSYFTTATPYVQLTMGGVGNVLADQTAWSSAIAAGSVTASEDNGVVTVDNTGAGALKVPVTVPPGTTLSGVQSGYHQLGIGNDGLCLDVYGASTSAGAAIDQWTCKSASQGNTNQEFQFVPTSGGYGELQAQNSGDDVAVAGSSTVAGVPDIVQQSPNGASNSQWLPIPQSNGSYEFQNQNSKLCLDVYHAGSNLGQQLDQWPCKSPGAGTNQAFSLTGASGLQSYGGVLSNWLNVAGSSVQTLTESVAPAITSAATAAAIESAPFSFTVQTTGEPAPALTETGTLPSGLTFVNNGNGTATISGTSTGAGGVYPITVTATNAAGTATQSFVLANSTAPAITSPAAVTFATGVVSTYVITTTGYPAPTLSDSGSALPTGLSFTDNGNGTGTISGTPAAGSQGTYPVTVSATNASGSTATLDLAVTVAAPASPAITSPAAAYFTLGTLGAFAITSSGAPTPVISETGALPAGLTYTANGSGGATITGDPTATGTTNLSITVANGVSPNATQTLSVIVGQAPTITSASLATALVGTAFGFTVATTGYPAPSLGETGALPTGLTFINNGNGTATISGTPASTAVGSYVLDLVATNGTATSSQTFTLTVSTPQAPAFTSAATATETVGTAFSFTVSATGTPTPTPTFTGTLPSGVTFTANTNGTASLSGTSAVAAGVYHLTLAATNSAGTASQAFTLAVNLQGGYHQFVINNDSLCLDVYGASTSAGAAIDQWTCKSASQGYTNQEFQFVPSSGGYGALQAQNSGDDVAVAGSSTVAGVPDIVQQSPNGAANSQWLPIAQSNGSYELQNQNSKLCLDVYQAGSNLGQQLDQWPCKSPGAGTNQAFALR